MSSAVTNFTKHEYVYFFSFAHEVVIQLLHGPNFDQFWPPQAGLGHFTYYLPFITWLLWTFYQPPSPFLSTWMPGCQNAPLCNNVIRKCLLVLFPFLFFLKQKTIVYDIIEDTLLCTFCLVMIVKWQKLANQGHTQNCANIILNSFLLSGYDW